MTERIAPSKIPDKKILPTHEEKPEDKTKVPEKPEKKVDMPIYSEEELKELFTKPDGQYWF